MKLTAWDTEYQHPARPGVYERDYSPLGWNFLAFSYWDGFNWYYRGSTPQEALLAMEQDEKSALAYLPWRGVAE